MDPKKVQSILSWPTPCSIKDICSFLGFANFYHHFIHNFADIAKLLNALTRKDKKWIWGEVEQEVFSALKHATTSAVDVIVVHPMQQEGDRLLEPRIWRFPSASSNSSPMHTHTILTHFNSYHFSFYLYSEFLSFFLTKFPLSYFLFISTYHLTHSIPNQLSIQCHIWA